MFVNERISLAQGLILTTTAASGLIFLDIPTFAVHAGGRQGWLSIVPEYLIGVVIIYSTVKLGQKYPDQTVIQYAPNIMGVFVGKLFGLSLIVAFTILAGLLVRLNTEVLLLLMPKTTSLMFDILIMGLVIYVVKWGFEVFARVCQVLIPLIILGLMLISLLSLENWEIGNMLPLFENGIAEPLYAVPNVAAFASEAALFLAFWFCTLENKTKGFYFNEIY